MNIKQPSQAYSALQNALTQAKKNQDPKLGDPVDRDATKGVRTDVIAGVPQREGKPGEANTVGGIAVELDPSKRPALDGFDRGGLSAMIDLLHPQTEGRAKSAAEMRDAAGSLDIFTQADSKPADFLASIDAELRATTGRAEPVDDGGLKTNPRTQQQMGDPPAESTPAATTPPADDKKTTGEKIADGAKAVGSFVRDWVIDLVVTKSGPPGPWLTPLTGPAALDGAGGDTGAILDGAKAVGGMQDGNYYERRILDAQRTPTPDAVGSPANAGEAAAKTKIGKLIAAMVGPIADRLRATDKSNITLPSEDGSNRPRPTKDDFGSRPDPKSSPRTGNQVNPGSGDHDILVGGVGSRGPLPSRDPGFVDPPEMIGGESPHVPSGGSKGPGSPEGGEE